MAAFDLNRFLAELAAFVAEADDPLETVRYGPHPEQELDVRRPAGRGDGRVAALLHGGFWRAAFTRTNTAALAVDLTRRGWTTCNVEYRRVGCDGGVPETLDDVAAALDLVAHTLAPARPVVLGHSAGGHLALWAAGTGKPAAAVSLAGVTDLAEAARAGLGDAAAIAFAGGTPAERPEAYELADPMRRLPARVPTLLVHGDADDRVPVEQSRRYAATAGASCELLELPGVGHFELIDPRSAVWAQAVSRLDEL